MLLFLLLLSVGVAGAYAAGVRPHDVTRWFSRPTADPADPADAPLTPAQQLGADAAASAAPRSTVDVTDHPRSDRLRQDWAAETVGAFRRRLVRADQLAASRWEASRRRQEQTTAAAAVAQRELRQAETEAAGATPRWAILSSRRFVIFATLILWAVDTVCFHQSMVMLGEDFIATWLLSGLLGTVLLAAGIGAGALLHRTVFDRTQTPAQQRTRGGLMVLVLLVALGLITTSYTSRQHNDVMRRTTELVDAQRQQAPKIDTIGSRTAVAEAASEERAATDATPTLPAWNVPSAAFLPFVQLVALLIALLISLAHRDDHHARERQRRDERARKRSTRIERMLAKVERSAGNRAEAVRTSQRHVVRFAETAIGRYDARFAEARVAAVDAGAADLIVPPSPTVEDVLTLISPHTIPRLEVPMPTDPLPPVPVTDVDEPPVEGPRQDPDVDPVGDTAVSPPTTPFPGADDTAPTRAFPRERPVTATHHPTAGGDAPRADPFVPDEPDAPRPARRETPAHPPR